MDPSFNLPNDPRITEAAAGVFRCPSANDLKQCFPTISAPHPQAFDEIWAKAANALRDNMLVRLYPRDVFVWPAAEMWRLGTRRKRATPC